MLSTPLIRMRNALPRVNGRNATWLATVVLALGLSSPTVAASATALHLDGTGDYATAASSSAFNFGTGDFTLAGWIKIDTNAPATEQTIAGKSLGYQAGGYYNGYRLLITGNVPVMTLCNGQSYKTIAGSTAIESATWHHIAGVRSGTNLALYVDGELAASEDDAIAAGFDTTTGYDFAIGAAKYWAASRYLYGGIDQVVAYGRALTQLEMYRLMSIGPDLDDADLVGSYSFDNSLTADDTGNGHSLTLYSDTSDTTGTRGSHHTLGASFGGSSDYVTISDSSANFTTNDFSISAWVKIDPSSSTGDHTIAGKNIALQAGGYYTGYRLWHNSGRVVLSVCDGQSQKVLNGPTLTTDQWHHVVGIRSGTDLLIYVDGECAAAARNAMPASYNVYTASYPFSIGSCVYWAVSRYFNGEIDGVALHKRALGEQEILELMSCGPQLWDPDLVLHVPFDDGSADDVSSYALATTIVGSPVAVLGARWNGYDEVEQLGDKISGFNIVSLPTSGTVTLGTSDSISQEDVRGIELDDTDLSIQSHEAYSSAVSDGLAAGTGPYVASNIAPFRLKYFLNEFDYLGWHNAEMIEYAGVHGFQSVFKDATNLWFMPVGTQCGGQDGLNYTSWMIANGYVDASNNPCWHEVPDAETIAAMHETAGLFTSYADRDNIYIDLESPAAPLTLAALRVQTWYPSGGTPSEKVDFEVAYYEGFANAEIATILAAHSAGNPSVGIYGVYNRSWFNIGDPIMQERWDLYISDIAMFSDVMYSSVYSFYPSQNNVGYVLANLDLTESMRTKLPLGLQTPQRPFFWNQLHGGGGGWRWWAGQPVYGEDYRAMTGLAFFTGIDGVVQWGWSANDYHSSPPVLAAGKSAIVSEAFTVTPEGGGTAHTFERNHPIYILGITGSDARFQALPTGEYYSFPQVDATPTNAVYDDGDYQYPVYARNADSLRADLVPMTEPIRYAIEGLAMVKLVEGSLKHGVPTIDPTASAYAYNNGLPLVRHVRLGDVHLLASFNPRWRTDGATTVTLEDFAGISGLDIVVPADENLRFFVLHE
ncbi:MAG: LamG domain-containing protein [Lentisphaerae bacterium]|nr:LamG domain-containing protein [Lentisphaerota bacterium]